MKTLMVFFVAVILFSCSGTKNNAQTGPTSFKPTGLFKHPVTGIEFPKEVGDFVREDVSYFNAEKTDLSAILPEEVEEEVKAAAEISMGTEVLLKNKFWKLIT